MSFSKKIILTVYDYTVMFFYFYRRKQLSWLLFASLEDEAILERVLLLIKRISKTLLQEEQILPFKNWSH